MLGSRTEQKTETEDCGVNSLCCGGVGGKGRWCIRPGVVMCRDLVCGAPISAPGRRGVTTYGSMTASVTLGARGGAGEMPASAVRAGGGPRRSTLKYCNFRQQK